MVDCDRNRSHWLDIYGRDFGSVGATVLVRARVRARVRALRVCWCVCCVGVAMLMSWPDLRLRLLLPLRQIGELPCGDVSHDPADPHGHLQCYLMPAYGLKRQVIVVQLVRAPTSLAARPLAPPQPQGVRRAGP